MVLHVFMFAKFNNQLGHEGRERTMPLFLALHFKNSVFAEAVYSFDYLGMLQEELVWKKGQKRYYDKTIKVTTYDFLQQSRYF